MEWMILPVAATVLMAVVLGWFGLHVLEREVIFVDLALAQVAALGATYAVFLGHEPDEPVAYALGLLFTVVGALAFAMARHFQERVPQEALIGIAYVVCAAGGAVLMDFAADPHGAEKLQHLLVGNVVWIRPVEIATIAGASALVGAVHWFARGPLLDVSFRPDEMAASGRRLWVWDLVFYLTFGVVITSLVHVAGVLLIFSYLIIPAVTARLFVHGVGPRLAVAWSIGIGASVVGVSASYEHAAGPIIVVLLGTVLLTALVAVGMRASQAPLRAAGVLFGGATGFAAVLMTVAAVVDPAHDHAVEHPHDATPVHHDLPASAASSEREQWYRGHLTQPDALKAAAAREDDPSLLLLLGTALTRAGDPEGLKILARVAAGETPFLRMEADDRLRSLAGESAPTGDPLSGPVSGWSSWSPPADWTERAADIALP